MKRAFMPAYVLAMHLRGDLPDSIVNKSLELYSLLLRKHATKGRAGEGLVKACFNITCKQLNFPFTFPSVEPQEKFINHILCLASKRVSSDMFVSKLGFELGLSELEISKAISLVKEEFGLGPASAAIHTVSKISLRRLARHTGLSKNYIWRLSKVFFYEVSLISMC